MTHRLTDSLIHSNEYDFYRGLQFNVNLTLFDIYLIHGLSLQYRNPKELISLCFDRTQNTAETFDTDTSTTFSIVKTPRSPKLRSYWGRRWSKTKKYRLGSGPPRFSSWDLSTHLSTYPFKYIPKSGFSIQTKTGRPFDTNTGYRNVHLTTKYTGNYQNTQTFKSTRNPSASTTT